MAGQTYVLGATCINAAPGSRPSAPYQVNDMPARVVCFTLGAILPLASIGWLLAYH